MKVLKFYRCNVCGNIAIKLVDSGIPMVCCGQPMIEIVANTTDAAQEKHVPVVTRNADVVDVKVGSVPHPMTNEHYFQFIVLETEENTYIKELQPNDAPEAKFLLSKDKKIKAVYAYCNLHSLWVSTTLS